MTQLNPKTTLHQTWPNRVPKQTRYRQKSMFSLIIDGQCSLCSLWTELWSSWVKIVQKMMSKQQPIHEISKSQHFDDDIGFFILLVHRDPITTPTQSQSWPNEVSKRPRTIRNPLSAWWLIIVVVLSLFRPNFGPARFGLFQLWRQNDKNKLEYRQKSMFCWWPNSNVASKLTQQGATQTRYRRKSFTPCQNELLWLQMPRELQTVLKSDDSLVQQGWPFHKASDMCGRSLWLNGTPLSDCQSSPLPPRRLSSCDKYFAAEKLSVHSCRGVLQWMLSKSMNFNGGKWDTNRLFPSWLAFKPPVRGQQLGPTESRRAKQLNFPPLSQKSRSNVHSGPPLWRGVGGSSGVSEGVRWEIALRAILFVARLSRWVCVGNQFRSKWKIDVSVHFSHQSLEWGSPGNSSHKGANNWTPPLCCYVFWLKESVKVHFSHQNSLGWSKQDAARCCSDDWSH